MFDKPIRLIAQVCCLCIAAPFSLGLGAEPSIESVWPPVAQRGTTFQLKITGGRLKNCRDLVFYSSELSCQKIDVISENELLATVAAAPECRLANEPFRVLSDHGFSELRTLRVSPFPVILSAAVAEVSASGSTRRGSRSEMADGVASMNQVDSTAGTRQRGSEKSSDSPAVEITQLNSTLCGVLSPGVIDRYTVRLEAGQRLTAEMDAVRLGGELLDTVIFIKDPDGKVVASADDDPLLRQDPVVSLRATTAGVYELSVHETNYGGGEKSFYALHVGDFPAPSVAYPAGGQLGTQCPVRFVNSVTTETRSVLLPTDIETVRRFQLFNGESDRGSPTAIPFRISDFPNAFEASDSSNDSVNEQLVPATLPIALNGILERAGDVDYFAIDLTETEPLRIELFAARVGSPIDGIVTVLDSQQQILASNDDWDTHDSRVEFTPLKAGRYYVSVRDKLLAGGPSHVYRAEVTRITPTLTAFLPRPDRTSQLHQTIAIPKGNRVLAKIGIRREFIDCDVEGELTGLPVGVHASPFSIPRDCFWIPTILEAGNQADLSAVLADIKVVGPSGEGVATGGFAQTVDLVAESADQLFTSTTVDRLPIAVTEAVPFRIDLVPPTVELARNGTLGIRVQISRENSFNEAVRVELPFLPPWISCEPFVVIPAKETTAVYELKAADRALPRTWPLVATARVDTVSAQADTTSIDGREVASQVVMLIIGPAPIDGKLDALDCEQGETLSVVCQLARKSPIRTSMLAELEGLPNRVVCQSATVDPDANQVHFKLVVAEDAPVGEFDQVQCRLTSTIEDQRVSFVLAANSRLTIASKGKLFRDSSGRVLSPLEALKQTQNSNR